MDGCEQQIHNSPEPQGIIATAVGTRYPSRIVCLTEETTETLYLLGEGDRIVGISGYTVRPPEARQKPKVSAASVVRSGPQCLGYLRLRLSTWPVACIPVGTGDNLVPRNETPSRL
jgi:Periplasmic binding protein